MNNILTILNYTLREDISRKVFLAFFIISTITIFGFLFVFSMYPVDQIIPPEAAKDGKPGTPYYMILTGFLMTPIVSISTLGLLLSIFATSGLITSIMERGTVDLFLSKPVSRFQLLTGRITGSLLMVLVNLIYLIAGIWLVFSVFTGFYNWYLLTPIIWIFITFSALFGLIVLLGVLTKSSVPGMMAAYFVFIIGSPILMKKDRIIEIISAGPVIKGIINTFYYIIPQTDGITRKVMFPLLMEGKIESYEPLIQSCLLLFVFLGIALFIFEKKEL